MIDLRLESEAKGCLLGPPLDPIINVRIGNKNHLDGTCERHLIPLNSEEGTFFLNVILPTWHIVSFIAKVVPTRWRRWLQFCRARTTGF